MFAFPKKILKFILIFAFFNSVFLFASDRSSLSSYPFNKKAAEKFYDYIKSSRVDFTVTFEKKRYQHRGVAIYALFKGEVLDAHVPGYSDVIDHPMWIERINQKMESDLYKSMLEFCDDWRLIGSNCKKFNDTMTLDRCYYRRQADVLLSFIQKFENDLLVAMERGLVPDILGSQSSLGARVFSSSSSSFSSSSSSSSSSLSAQTSTAVIFGDDDDSVVDVVGGNQTSRTTILYLREELRKAEKALKEERATTRKQMRKRKAGPLAASEEGGGVSVKRAFKAYEKPYLACMSEDSSEYKRVLSLFEKHGMGPLVEDGSIRVWKIINEFQKDKHKSYKTQLLKAYMTRHKGKKLDEVIWQYEDHGVWVDYLECAQKVIFKMASEGHKVIDITFSDRPDAVYILDLEKKTQVRKSSGFSRRIRKLTREQACLGEKILFNGPANTSPNKIWASNEGLDSRMSRRKGNFLGVGVYAAQRLTYGHLYAFRSERRVHRLFLCEAYCGETIDFRTDKQELTRPPARPEGGLYDSVVGGPYIPTPSNVLAQKHCFSKIHAFYSGAQGQIIPQLLIQYTAREGFCREDLTRRQVPAPVVAIRKAVSSHVAGANARNSSSWTALPQGVTTASSSSSSSNSTVSPVLHSPRSSPNPFPHYSSNSSPLTLPVGAGFLMTPPHSPRSGTQGSSSPIRRGPISPGTFALLFGPNV